MEEVKGLESIPKTFMESKTFDSPKDRWGSFWYDPDQIGDKNPRTGVF